MNKITVLDHGYVGMIESYGSDQSIIEAARMSTNKGFLGWGDARTCPRCNGTGRQLENPDMNECSEEGCEKGIIGKVGDEKLLKYLYEHKHSTPFEMAGMIIEVQAPIMVFREWHRHRTQSYAEMSARYTPLPDVNYLPTIERLMMRDAKNKQAQSAKGQILIEALAEEFRLALAAEYAAQQGLYELALELGVPKELARLMLPVGRYSRMRAHANLRNWLGFLTLRMDPAAQWEIRQFANVVGTLVEQRYPRTWELFLAHKTW
jgi:thymidylate synthase (FAD)